jgi:hypothetical protein
VAVFRASRQKLRQLKTNFLILLLSQERAPFGMKYDLIGEYALEENEEVITIIINTNKVSAKYSNIVRMDGFKK